MEVETAARRMLLSYSAVRGYVGTKVYKYRLEQKVDQTGKRAIVVARNNGWATPDPVKTAEFPILSVKIYSDPYRDETGSIVTMNAEDNAWAVYRVIDKIIHGRRAWWWGAKGTDAGLLIASSRRYSEPMLVTEKDQHGQGAGDPLGDSVYVYVEYALEVVNGSPVAGFIPPPLPDLPDDGPDPGTDPGGDSDDELDEIPDLTIWYENGLV